MLPLLILPFTVVAGLFYWFTKGSSCLSGNQDKVDEDAENSKDRTEDSAKGCMPSPNVKCGKRQEREDDEDRDLVDSYEFPPLAKRPRSVSDGAKASCV